MISQYKALYCSNCYISSYRKDLLHKQLRSTTDSKRLTVERARVFCTWLVHVGQDPSNFSLQIIIHIVNGTNFHYKPPINMHIHLYVFFSKVCMKKELFFI